MVSRRLQIISASFIVLLLLCALYLLGVLYTFRNTISSNKPGLESMETDVPSGELGLDGAENVSVPFEQTDINNVWVKSVRRYKSDNNKPLVDLELGYIEGGRESVLKITLAGKVYFSEYSSQNGSDYLASNGKMDINDVIINEGEFAVVTIAYFVKQGYSNNKLLIYCSTNDDVVCDTYPDLGFGTGPIDGNLNTQLTKEINILEPSKYAVRGYTRNLAIPPKS